MENFPVSKRGKGCELEGGGVEQCVRKQKQGAGMAGAVGTRLHFASQVLIEAGKPLRQC